MVKKIAVIIGVIATSIVIFNNGFQLITIMKENQLFYSLALLSIAFFVYLWKTSGGKL